MTRIVPFPLASSILFALWLLLNQTFSIAHILLGSAVALVGGWALARLDPPKTLPRSRLLAIPQLFAFVFTDIVRSNVAVAAIILSFKPREGLPAS